MRLQDKRILSALNFDDADEMLQNGDMRSALNIRVNITESGDDGVVENTKGNVSKFSELSFSLPAGTNKTVGTCTDDQNNRLIWFNYNSNNNHGIYAYNDDLNSIDTVMVSSVLNFDQNLVIHSIDILNNLLSWVDNNRPRAINVKRAIAGEYGATITEAMITDAKLVPMLPPVVSSFTTRGTDYIKSLRSFQFIYRYVFLDGYKGAWSTVSKLVSTGYNGVHIDKISLDVSGCELFTNPELLKIINYVEFASRELYTFNFNQFSRMTSADVVSAGGLIYYYDTESKTAIDTAETDLSFSSVPIRAGSVAYQNERKFYADCTEGYDAFDLTLSNINDQVIPASGGIPYLSDCDTHVNQRYLKPDSEYSFAIEWHDEYGIKSGASTQPELTIRTQAQMSNDYKANVLQFTLNTADSTKYPAWAKKFEVLRSENKSVNWFAQGRANNILYCTGYDTNNAPQYIKSNPGPGNENATDASAVELHIDISNWTKYNINIPYVFTEGDRVTFFTMGGSVDGPATSDFKSLKIKSQRGGLLVLDYNGAGRTVLNDINQAETLHDVHLPIFPFTLLADQLISRFIVGNNGVVLCSVRSVLTGAPYIFDTSFANVFKIAIPATTENLTGVTTIYNSATPENTSVSVYIVGTNGYFLKFNFDPIAVAWGSFTAISTGTTEDINSIQSDWTLHNQADLILVGNGGLILKYHVATGVITQLVSGTTENLNSVARSRSTGTYIICGDHGTILRSTDGTNWTTITSDFCQNFNSIFINASKACIVGDEGVCLMTANDGLTWNSVDLFTKYNLYTVDGEGSDTRFVYIGGQFGYVGYASLDTQQFAYGFNPATTEDIHRIFSWGFPGDRNRGYIVGNSDLLEDVNFVTPTFTDYSTYVAALYGTTILNYKAKFEVYSPKLSGGPTIYYETGDAYLVGSNYTINNGKSNNGDVFFIAKDFQGVANGVTWVMKGDPVFSMTPNALSTTNAGANGQITVAWDKDLGRPNIVLLYPELQTRRNIIRFSDKYIQNSQINGLSNFQSLNYETVPSEYGIIRKITPLESVILINCEREAATAYIDLVMLTGAQGQESVGLSSNVINNIQKLAGGFGCTNPESVEKYLGKVYFYSSNKAAVCRYNNSNGIFPVSNYKARTLFYNIDSSLTNTTVMGGLEPKFRNYLLTLSNLFNTELIVNGNFASALVPLVGFKKILRSFPFTVSTTTVIGNSTTGYNLAVLHDTGHQLFSNAIIVVGKRYTVTFDVLDITAGKNIDLDGSDGVNTNTTIYSVNSVGTHSVTFVADRSGISFYTTASNGLAEVAHIKNISLKEVLVDSSQTIAFQDDTNRWISRYSFIPEKYGHIKTHFFSFVSGVLWKHNQNPLYNNFYGVQYPCQVEPVFNSQPSTQKNFNCISLETDSDEWSAPSITTAQGQETYLLSGHFERINKELWADVLQDINTPNVASGEVLFNGDYMQSNALTVLLENTSTSAIKLRFANLYSSINERTNK